VGNDGVNSWDYLGWVKYFVGRTARSLQGSWISVPKNITIDTPFGSKKIPVPGSAALENLINTDAGHHNVAVWCDVDEDGKPDKFYVLGLFADDFKEAAVGAGKEAVANIPGMSLIVPTWLAASWVDGHLLSPKTGIGKIVEKHEITKAEYDSGLKKLKGLEGKFQSYSLFHNNCQNFADRMIRAIK
jgi:hypothetical protein